MLKLNHKLSQRWSLWLLLTGMQLSRASHVGPAPSSGPALSQRWDRSQRLLTEANLLCMLAASATGRGAHRAWVAHEELLRALRNNTRLALEIDRRRRAASAAIIHVSESTVGDSAPEYTGKRVRFKFSPDKK